jgi:ribosomal protein S18 acetylase RimI-like enzyme
VEHARDAVHADLARVAELGAELHDELARERGGDVWLGLDAIAEPLTEGYAGYVGEPGRRLVAGMLDDVVVGYATFELRALADGRLVAHVRELYVEREAREVGVGEALVTRVLELAREHGCIGVDAVALPGMRATKNFFETHGFTARALEVHRSIDGAPTEPADS